jgi:hypothetical protein
MTYKLVGDTLGVDHSTVIYGSNKAKNQVEIGDRQYTIAMVNWRMIFDENEIDIKVEVDQKARVKARIQNLLIDAITDGVLSIEERDELLVSMLKTKMIHSNRLREEQLY